MQILYQDKQILVCQKPAGVLSTDEPGGLPSLLREQLGPESGKLRTVHRLDRVVSGLMVLARDAEAASELSRQMREGIFHKEYLTVIHWRPSEPSGRMTDLLRRDPVERKTYVTKAPGKDARLAILDYETVASGGGLSLLRIHLQTGRTHQIRAQLSSRGLPIVGDRKYSRWPDECPIALFSCRLTFLLPETGTPVAFSALPPEETPWTQFARYLHAEGGAC